MYLTNETKALLEKRLGKSLSEIRRMDLDEEIAFVEKRTGKKLGFSRKVDSRMMSRGNPLLAQGRITTKEQENKWFKKLK